MSRTVTCFGLLAVLLAGCAIKVTEPKSASQARNAAQAELRRKSEANLRELGQAYLLALASAPPKNIEDLKAHMQQADQGLVSPRDQQPYETVWGVDPDRLPDPANETALAWEKSADADGSRCVLLADCRTVVYMNEELFRTTTKAKTR